MFGNSYPLRCALLVAALAQALPVAAAEADAEKETDKEAEKAEPCNKCPDFGGWSGWVEGGIASQSDDSFVFGRYTGFEEEGFSLNAGADVRYRNKDGTYANGKAMDLGLESRGLILEGGKQGKYGITFEYDQIPNFREDSGRSIFRQNGAQLAPPAGWVPIATVIDNVGQIEGALTSHHLKTERDRTGVKFSFIPSKRWEISGYFRHEEKDGTTDIGATFGTQQDAILPAPLNYRTDDFGLTLGYLGEKFQAQLAYAGSLFKNDDPALMWANAFTPTPEPTTGRIAGAPGNQFHQISALLGYQLSDKTRLGARLSRGRMTQDESFLPFTTHTIATPPLPASSLDGKVDTTLAKLDINSRPTRKFRLDASYTYSDRDNNSRDLTSAYVVTDVFLATNPATGLPILRRNRPYSFEQHLLRVKAGYRLPKDADLSGGFDYDQMDRTYQQVEETKDKTVWAKLKLLPLDGLETTLKYSYSDRDASAFMSLASQDPLLENPLFPESVNPLMRAFELADRRRDKIGLDVAYNPAASLSLGLAVDHTKDDYQNMVLGLTEATGLTVTPSVTYVFSEDLSASAFYTYDKLESDQAGQYWLSSPPPGFVPLSWMESDSNLTETVGLNANWKAIPEKLDLGVSLVYSTFKGKIRYANAPAMPDLSSHLTAIGMHGIYKIDKNFSLRAGYQYQKYKESDWAEGGDIGSLPLLSLNIAEQNAETHLLFLTLRYEINPVEPVKKKEDGEEEEEEEEE